MNIKKSLSLAVVLSGLLTAGAQADGNVYLYTMFHDDNTNGERFRTKMKDMEQCLDVLIQAKLHMPNAPAGDYEVMGAMWCGGDMERNYNAKWYADEEIDLGS
jgi:hypothetical protein